MINNSIESSATAVSSTSDLTVSLVSCAPQPPQSPQSPQLASSTSSAVAVAVLSCRKNSHPFQERRICLDASAKVGRAVARCKPTTDNAIFDCKVLSRNHALLWYDEGKFYLQDTRSSNGTFINNQRLSPANEESQPREVCSGDVVQFGVDVMENSRKVTHGCIIATVKLYLPDGTEAKASRVVQSEEASFNTSQMQNFLPNVYISTQELYQLSQYLNEALHREQILQNKVTTLQRVVTSAQEVANSGWKSLVEEDRLLSRIETLQSKLEVCLNSGKSKTGDNSVNSIKEEMLKLIDEKEKYECAAKEAIQKALEEKLLVLTRLHELEASVKTYESDCIRLQEVCEDRAKEIDKLANYSDDVNKELEDVSKRLSASETQRLEVADAAKREKLLLEEKIAELKTKEAELSELIDELKAMNDSANTTIEQLKAQLNIKQEIVINSDGLSDNNNSKDLKLSDELSNIQKQLDLSNDRCKDLTAQIDILKNQQINGLTVVNDNNATNLNIINNIQPLTNGEIKNSTNNCNISANCVIMNDNNIEFMDHNSCNDNNEPITSHFNSEIDVLKELLADTRASKKTTEEELSKTSVELQNVTSNMNKIETDLYNYQQKLNATLKEMEEKSVAISSMKNQFNSVNEKLNSTLSDCESFKCKITDSEKSLQLRDEEISSLKVLLEEERKIQNKYFNNLEQCRKQLIETQHSLKQSQTEVEFLRKKVYSVNEELRSSRSNLSISDESNRLSRECDKLKSDYSALQSKFHGIESELSSYRDSNRKILLEYERLQHSYESLQALNEQLESRGDDYLRDQLNKAKSEAAVTDSELFAIKQDLDLLKQNFDKYSEENEILKEELKSARDDYDIVSYQNKIASACAIVPLILLLIAVLMAYYPSVSSVTGTTDS